MAAIVIVEWYWNVLLYLCAVAWIGGRMHGLAVIMHEGVHYRLLPKKRLNDLVSEIVLSWPLFFTMRGFRRNHLAHHRNPNTVRDPDWMRKQSPEWEFPKTWRSLAWLILKDLLGLSIPAKLREFRPYREDFKSNPGFGLARLSFYLLIAVLLTYFDLWRIFVLYWIVPFCTWLSMTAHLRSIADHFAVDDGPGFTGKTRTTRLNLLEKLLFSPNNINYHIEHHLYPSIPYYNLPSAHVLLMQNPEYKANAHVTYSMWGLLKECLGNP